jgi:hypothetical protein
MGWRGLIRMIFASGRFSSVSSSSTRSLFGFGDFRTRAKWRPEALLRPESRAVLLHARRRSRRLHRRGLRAT